MRLANFGMIGLNGTVMRPEPSADFADYQNSLANYQMTLDLRRRVQGNAPKSEDRLSDLAAAIRKTLAGDNPAEPQQAD